MEMVKSSGLRQYSYERGCNAVNSVSAPLCYWFPSIMDRKAHVASGSGLHPTRRAIIMGKDDGHVYR